MATTGSQYGAVCYADAMSAGQAACRDFAGVTSAGVVQCTGVTPSLAGPVLALETTPASGPAVVSSLTLAVTPCDPFAPYADMVELFGLAMAAFVAVWTMKNFVLKLVLPQ